MSMNVFICSSRRSERLSYILKFFKECRIYIVCPVGELGNYKIHAHTGARVIGADACIDLPHANQLALTIAHREKMKHMIMVDDDAVFYKKSGKAHPLVKIESGGDEMYRILLHRMLSNRTILAGIGQDRVHYSQAYPYDIVKPITTLQMIDVGEFVDRGIRFDRVETHQDTDVTLQCLKAGFPTVVSTEYVAKTPQTIQTGGCDYRSVETFNRAAQEMVRLHPDCVSIYYANALKRWIADEPMIAKIRCSYIKAYRSSK